VSFEKYRKRIIFTRIILDTYSRKYCRNAKAADNFILS